MEVKLPKAYSELSRHDKDLINQAMTEEVQKQVDKDMAELQKLWLQFACIVLNRNFGFGRKRALLFLANWREIYRLNKQLKTKAEQTEYLTAEMDRIFGRDGYPKEYIDKLEEI